MAISNPPRFSAHTNPLEGNDTPALQQSFVHHLEYSLAKDEYTATQHDAFTAAALLVRDRLIEKWIDTQQQYYKGDVKRVYYLSLEFLMGRTLGNAVMNLDLDEPLRDAIRDLGYRYEQLREVEFDAGLGNGGLGRLAACFLDSMATLQLPAYGYGIRYDYGIFFQKIENGWQVESPDNWLRYGNPWEFGRPELLYPVHFYGRVNQFVDATGRFQCEWVDTQDVMAMAYDTPIPGYRNGIINTLRLWSAKATREFDLNFFNHGDYEQAVGDKSRSETISHVLYPNDNFFMGRELRLKQEYFFVAASLQDILRRHRKDHGSLESLAQKTAIQLNDTHPALAIPELMRLLVDEAGMDWEPAWDITVATCAYTNHTVLPEALENWPEALFSNVLPRHWQIIQEINRRLLAEVTAHFGEDAGRTQRMTLISQDGEPCIRMAPLAITGSHKVNGVAELHSQILRDEVFPDFNTLWPERFTNKTNGITQRRWLKLCNPGLTELIIRKIGEHWITDLDQLQALRECALQPDFVAEWRAVKLTNKQCLAQLLSTKTGGEQGFDPASLLDCQVKRIHEYKRQLLNLLHVVTLYLRLRDNPGTSLVAPRTVLFAGKAAPGYAVAKLIIKLINTVAEVVNHDPISRDQLHLIFVPNYGVSLAEQILPAADLSEQISTAGMEASGTSNMKFALNGALTIGTLDGANVELREEVGPDNIFIFGLEAHQIRQRQQQGYDPSPYWTQDVELGRVLDWIGALSGPLDPPGLFTPLVDSLRYHDPFFLLADFRAYVDCHQQVAHLFADPDAWHRTAIYNVAGVGKFSSDRTIRDYAREIWQVPVQSA